ncbi:MAG TPA: hypothetical protein VHC70_03125 [Phycisphaerales bacterium]|jgi:hypothetical protein|nr:hypothetical protein [Phycisphaerales bacterium]
MIPHPPLAPPPAPRPPAPEALPQSPDLLLQFLADRDHPCPGCGYNLRALTVPRCPECNEPLKLQAGLVEPKLAWFIVGVVGLAMGAGFGLLVYGAIFLQSLMRGFGPSMWQGWPILATGVLCGVLTWAWILARRRLNSRPAPLRWGLALLTHVLSVGLAVLCVLFVR